MYDLRTGSALVRASAATTTSNTVSFICDRQRDKTSGMLVSGVKTATVHIRKK